MTISNGSADALELLLYAWERAKDVGAAPREFAVEIERLMSIDAMECDLRWLIYGRYIDHFVDSTQPRERGRRLDPFDSLSLLPMSCFALTRKGLGEAKRLRKNKESALPPPTVSENGAASPHQVSPHQILRPRWVARQLWVAKIVVKRLKRASPNQEPILDEFERLGWPHELDDPLSFLPGLRAKKRLHDTINSLNQFDQPGLIRFRGNGRGTAICWEFESPPDAR